MIQKKIKISKITCLFLLVCSENNFNIFCEMLDIFAIYSYNKRAFKNTGISPPVFGMFMMACSSVGRAHVKMNHVCDSNSKYISRVNGVGGSNPPLPICKVCTV